ncbi:MAG TPA: hypothetical protein VLF89_01125 [Candidatus Saccharimonadales bacterium]|nr:hypothetical protein [Candidatus Saccharimonadales bacterium]
MKNLLRFILAIIFGIILGNLIAIIAAIGIDASYNASVTGQSWKFTLPNVEYTLAIGFLGGFIGGIIAKKKGVIIGAIIELIPLLFLLLGSQTHYEVNPIIWQFIGLIPAMCGGYLGELLINDEEWTSLFRNIKWNWLWLWIILIITLYVIALSFRFLINDFVMGWEVIFIPRLWIFAIFGFPIVSGLLYATFSVPFVGLGYLIDILGNKTETKMYKGNHKTGMIFLIILGVPISLYILYVINTFILNFLVSNGLRLV